jgi:hypothetical protein
MVVHSLAEVIQDFAPSQGGRWRWFDVDSSLSRWEGGNVRPWYIGGTQGIDVDLIASSLNSG